MKKITIIFLTATLFFSIAYFNQKKETEFYKSTTNTALKYGFQLSKKIDSLETAITILSTDTISVSSWKFDGDTIEYLGNDTIITLPHYYRIEVIANEFTGNTSWNVVYKTITDTLINK